MGVMEVRSSGILGKNTTYRLDAHSWTERDCDRVIQLLRMVRDWLEQDDAASRDQWREVTTEEVETIDKLVAPEFATGTWQTVESESD